MNLQKLIVAEKQNKILQLHNEKHLLFEMRNISDALLDATNNAWQYFVALESAKAAAILTKVV